MKKLLPIGSVVQLYGGTKKIMIMGYYSKSSDNDKMFDYNGCVFPEGVMEEIYCLFNSDQIETVYFKGLENEQSEEYMKKIDMMVAPNVVSDRMIEKSDNKDGNSAYRRTPKAPTKPMSSSDMKVRYGIVKNSRNTVDR